ncbi:MAG: VOC family protein [Nocardioidaceae bacterium]
MTDSFGRWIGAVLDVPAEQVEAADGFWSQALGWTVGDPWPQHAEFHSLLPPEGNSHVLVQTIDGPSRVHLDLYTEDVASESDRAVGLGGARVARHEHWQVLESPGGLPFCVVTSEDERHRPPVQEWPSGRRSRLVQVCVDIPHGRLDEETAFWRAVTGWEFKPSASVEFAGHLKPGPGGSLQLLLQELGPDDPAATTRAHLDLGAGDDRRAEAERLVALGAEWVREYPWWIVMTDPVGMTFCVTGQGPDQPPQR